MSDDDPSSAAPARTERRARGSRLRRWAPALLALALIALMGLVLWGKLRDEVWAYFTDDAGTRVEVQDDKTRRVLWEDPSPNHFQEQPDPAAPAIPDPVNQPTGRLEAAFSADGTMMVLVRWDEEQSNADMYQSRWDGRTWTRPEAIASVNTETNERGPALSRDGDFLYFSSDREGGQGGYDLYVARWDGKAWASVEALGTSINTAADEFGPALSADDSQLYFSSAREGAGAEDIFAATRIAVDEELEPDPAPEPKPDPNSAPPIPPVPQFAKAEPVNHLNSTADDVQAALTKRGDHVFLASDRDRDDKTGFGVYLSRVVDGKSLPPEQVDLYIDAGEATDPAVRMEGFDLLFSTDIGGDKVATPDGEEEPIGFRLFRSTTREVFGYTDLSRWEQFKELLGNIIWWILLALAALIALIYLLERWRDITSLFHKCLAGSGAVHLIVILLMMIWLIKKELNSGGEQQAPEIAISIDALAQEELALESTPEEAEMADSKVAIVTEKIDSDFVIPLFKPQQDTTQAPIVASTAKVSLVSDVRPSKANQASADEPVPQPADKTPMLSVLPQTLLPDPEVPNLPELTVTNPESAKEPADPLADQFVPAETLPKVETERTKETEIAESAVQKSTENEEIDQSSVSAETTDTGGDQVNPHTGLEAEGSPPKLHGTGNRVTTLLNLGGPDSRSDPLLIGELETPDNDLDAKALTKFVKKQRGRPSLETIEQLGGSDATEKAIGAALDWLMKNQEPDGRWDVRKHGANGAYDTAGVGSALLCFYGWGLNHTDGGKYQPTIKKAIDWLVTQQKENGDLRGGGRMYCHGIASIALCEAYGISKDPKLKEPAEKAIALILASQSTTKGGWRYSPANAKGEPHQDSDTSVTGWQYMALHSARMAGLDVPEASFELARRWFDTAGGGKHGGLYGYTGPGNVPAMVATGMFCRQLDLAPPTDPKMAESANLLKMRPMNISRPDYYYVYYATLALYQHQGPIWTAWNEKLKEILPLIQKKGGAENGSWDPSTAHAQAGGRVISTTLATLSLEVYYRLLPMYGFRQEDAPPAQAKTGG